MKIYTKRQLLLSLKGSLGITSGKVFAREKKKDRCTGVTWPLEDKSVQFSSVQPLSHVQLFVTPWTAAHQASLSITNSWSLLKLLPIESVMTSNHLILCHPFFSRLQSFPASGSFPMSQLFASGGQILEFQLQLQPFR